jgi:hypothetical protein
MAGILCEATLPRQLKTIKPGWFTRLLACGGCFLLQMIAT